MRWNRLSALFSFVLALSAFAENPPAPVTELNRIAPKPGLPYVELDGKLHFKNSADRVTFAGELGIAGGVVGVTSVDGMSGNVALDLPPTPQQYGAKADGLSHPLSEKYGSLAAAQADYPAATSLTDEIDWAAGQKVLSNFNVMYLPPGTYQLGNTNGGHAWVANSDSGQRIIGASRYVDPSSRETHQGVRINAAPGTDGIKFSYSSGKISDVTIYGFSVAISGITSGPSHDQQAVVTTASAHGLRTEPWVSGGWTITGNSTGNSPIITTSAPHGLTSGEYIQISGSGQSSLNHIFRVLVTDATGHFITDPSATSRWFRLATTDHIEPVTSADGGGASLARLYDVAVGPNYDDGREVKGAVPEVIGYYRALPVTTMTFKLFKWDNTAVVLSTDANANTGILYATQRALTFGDDHDIINGDESRPPVLSDADSGREFSATDIFTREVVVGIDGQASDGSGKIDHCFADCVAIAFLAGGNIDKMLVQACWVTSTSVSAYAITGNGGMTLLNSGGANNARLALLGTELNGTVSGGSHLKGVGVYNEGIQRATTAQGADFFAVDCGTNNRATFDDLVITARPANFCDFHCAGPAGFIGLTNSPGAAWLCWNQGGQVEADNITDLKVNLYGAGPTVGDYRTYKAGNYRVARQLDFFNPTLPISAIHRSDSTTVWVTMSDASLFSVGDHFALHDTYGSEANGANNDIGSPSVPCVVTEVNATQVKFTNSTLVLATGNGGGGVIEKLITDGLPGATYGNAGSTYIVLPESPTTLALGLWQSLLVGSRPQWVHVGFDSLEIARGGTGQTSFTAGDLLYASATNTLSKLPKGSDGQVLTIDAGTHLPVWSTPGSNLAASLFTGAYKVWPLGKNIWDLHGANGGGGDGYNLLKLYTSGTTGGSCVAVSAAASEGGNSGWLLPGQSLSATDMLNWGQRYRLYFLFDVEPGTVDSNTVIRFHLGDNYNTTTAADLGGKGIGLKITNTSFVAECHDGTTLNTASLSGSLSTGQGVGVLLDYDGAGTLSVYINGTLAGTCTGGPTGISANGNTAITASVTNGAGTKNLIMTWANLWTILGN